MTDIVSFVRRYREARDKRKLWLSRAVREAGALAPTESERKAIHYVPDRAAITRRDRDRLAEASGLTCRHSRWLWDSCAGCRRQRSSPSARHAMATLQPKMIAKLREILHV